MKKTEELTEEKAEAMFAGLENKSFGLNTLDASRDFFLDFYTSNELDEWRFESEKGLQLGGNEYDEMISAWVTDPGKAQIMSNELHRCCYRYDLQGFRNGVMLTLLIIDQIENMKRQAVEMFNEVQRKRGCNG